MQNLYFEEIQIPNNPLDYNNVDYNIYFPEIINYCEFIDCDFMNMYFADCRFHNINLRGSLFTNGVFTNTSILVHHCGFLVLIHNIHGLLRILNLII